MKPSTNSTTNVALNDIRRVCYFRMDPKTEIRLDQVDGCLCTHIILAFARIDSHGDLVVKCEADYAYLERVREFKRKHSGVKVMISVFNEEEFNGFPKIATDNECRQRFAKSVIEFLQRYHLDGIDLNWQFPNFPTNLIGAREHERTGLTKIIKTLRSAIVENFYARQLAEQQEIVSRPYATTPGSFNSAVEPHILTVAIAGQESVLRASYELKQLSNLCDWLNVMSYDYFLFKAYAPFTGPNSPLHPIVENYVPILSKLSLSWTVGRLLEEGLPSDKIVMGIPTFARAYKLIFKNTLPAPFALSVGPRAGQSDGYLSYREVIEILARDDTRVEFDERARVPYLLTDNGYTWISYENIRSVREKVNYILSRNLGGYMTWNLNYDDFVGVALGSSQQTNGRIASSSTTSSATFPLHRAMLDEVISHLSIESNSLKSADAAR